MAPVVDWIEPGLQPPVTGQNNAGNWTQRSPSEHRWKPDWDQKLPHGLFEASLTQGDAVRR